MRRNIPCAFVTVFLLAITSPCIMQAQITAGVSTAQNLPPAPTPSSAPAQTPQNQSVPMALPGTQLPASSANGEPTLTLAQAQAWPHETTRVSQWRAWLPWPRIRPPVRCVQTYGRRLR